MCSGMEFHTRVFLSVVWSMEYVGVLVLDSFAGM